MKRFAYLFLSVAIILVAAIAPTPGAGQAPAPSPQAPAVNPALRPAKKVFPTGAKSSRKHWLAYQATNHPRFVHQALAAPPQFTPAVILTPAQMSYWGNDQYGDCVTAEEAFAKDIYPVWYSAAGTPVNFPTSIVTGWARLHGWLNGADLTSVMDAMISEGITVNGITYTDGAYKSVDYTNWQVLTSAIYQGPVKIGMAAGQLQNTAGVGTRNGWVATGYRRDTNEDHCTTLCGYGTMQSLATAMGVTLPSGVNGSANGVLFYTWDTIGIMDFVSMTNVTGEAWLRVPTTPQTPPPLPNPPPTPTPTPTPTPAAITFALASGAPSGAAIDGSGVFTWPVPAAQPIGKITISFTASASGAAATNGSFDILITAAPSLVIQPIPSQSATLGQTMTLDLSKYVTQPTPGLPPVPMSRHHP